MINEQATRDCALCGKSFKYRVSASPQWYWCRECAVLGMRANLPRCTIYDDACLTPYKCKSVGSCCAGEVNDK